MTLYHNLGHNSCGLCAPITLKIPGVRNETQYIRSANVVKIEMSAKTEWKLDFAQDGGQFKVTWQNRSMARYMQSAM